MAVTARRTVREIPRAAILHIDTTEILKLVVVAYARVSTEKEEQEVWPYVVGGVVLAVIISMIIAISKRKKAIPHDKGIEEAEADDNGGSEE